MHSNASAASYRFADYRVPVVLRQMGILAYSAELALKVCIFTTSWSQWNVPHLQLCLLLGGNLTVYGATQPLHSGMLMWLIFWQCESHVNALTC